MKTILLALIASTFGILSLAADQSSPAFPLTHHTTLIQAEYLPTLPPGWQIVAVEPAAAPFGYPRERMFIVNPTTRQTAFWLIEFDF
jgi:hypothetical protein